MSNEMLKHDFTKIEFLKYNWYIYLIVSFTGPGRHWFNCHNRKQHFGLYFILCHREWVFVAGGSLRWLWSMVELVGAPVERFRCWRPSVVGPNLLLCGPVRPVVVEQWRVQSAKCRLGPKCWPSLAEETPHYTQESPAFSAHLPVSSYS